MFVPANSQIQGLETVLGNRLFQRQGFQLIAALELTLVRAHPLGQGRFVLGDNQVQVPGLSVFLPEFIDLFEFEGRIDVKDRKGYLAEKGLSNQPKQGRGVFADRPKHRHISELTISLSNNKDGLVFQLIKVQHTHARLSLLCIPLESGNHHWTYDQTRNGLT